MTSAAITVEPLASRPDAVVVIPGSKSHTNRALVCAGLAGGTSRLQGALFAQDTEAMVATLARLGCAVGLDRGSATIEIDGLDGRLPPGPLELDVAQSGTTSRFVLAMLTLGPGPYRLDADAQMRRRPLGPLIDALTTLGASIVGQQLPLQVSGGPLLAGTVPVSGSISSQFLSGLLLASPYALSPSGSPLIIELADELVSKPYVELTIDTMASFGVEVNNHDYRRFEIAAQRYEARRLTIEPDASAASYFFAAAAITGGRIRVGGLGTDTIQGDVRFVDVLEQMGASVERDRDWIEVRGTGTLRGVDVDMADISDTAQTLAIVATFASSPTRVRGIGFIKHKETDRLAAVVDELTKLGITAERSDDGFTIHPGRPRAGRVDTYDDHRMAMSFALLGLVHPGIELEGPGCVAKTFPSFFSTLDELRG